MVGRLGLEPRIRGLRVVSPTGARSAGSDLSVNPGDQSCTSGTRWLWFVDRFVDRLRRFRGGLDVLTVLDRDDRVVEVVQQSAKGLRSGHIDQWAVSVAQIEECDEGCKVALTG